MSWKIRSEHLDPIDQTHVTRLHDPERSSDPNHDHLVQVAIGMKSCPHCGRPYEKQGRIIDPKLAASRSLHMMKRIGQRTAAYAKRYGLMIKR